MIRETIQDVVANITETCMNEDVYVTDEESIHLPNRGTIIGIIKDLRRVVFPGYFGDENISSTMPGYFLGNMLTHIYEEMRTQIEIAFCTMIRAQAAEKRLRRRQEISVNVLSAVCHIFRRCF